MSVSRDAVLAVLAKVTDPESGRDLASMQPGVSIADEAVTIALEIDPAQAAPMQQAASAAEQALAQLPGVARVTVVLTAHEANPKPSAPPPPPPDLGRRAGPSDRPIRAEQKQEGAIPGVTRVIAVGSGKGGVGKSTVTCNLALALRAEGWTVGVLDADVYGPSQPRMLGLSSRPTSDGEMIHPLTGYGLKVMSMGSLVEEGQSVVWRGPMLMQALTQMLHQVAWGPLDALIVDLPPGTGDVQLTLGQKTELAGMVVVSTPQDVALIDARKAVDMCGKMQIPVLGMIENMSFFSCPNCGHEAHVFGHGGAQKEAEKIGAPFLGALPIELDTRLGSDEGRPVVAAAPDSDQAQRFREIARKLMAAL